MSYIQHLTGSTDLITPLEEIRAGFVALALERNRQATPFVEQARALKVLAQQVKYQINFVLFSAYVRFPNRTLCVNLVPYMLVGGVFGADNKSDRQVSLSQLAQMPHAR